MDDQATDSSAPGGSAGFYSLSTGPQLVLRPPTDVTSASTLSDVTSHTHASDDGGNASFPTPSPSSPPPSPPLSPKQQQTNSVQTRTEQRRRREKTEPPPHSGDDKPEVNVLLDTSYSDLNASRASHRPHDTSVDFMTATENTAYEYDPTEHDSNNLDDRYADNVSEHNVSYSRNLPKWSEEHNVSYSRNLPNGKEEHNVSYSRNLPNGREEHNVSYSQDLPNGKELRTAAEFKPNDSLDSIPLGPEDDDDYDDTRVDDSVVSPAAVGRTGIENEAYAYDGDYETDFSFQGGTPFEEGPTLRNKDPLPILERPVSGRYMKNPVLERTKPVVAKGPYIPQAGVYLNPPLAIKTDNPPLNTKVRKRIPRPPSKLRIKCAYFWSCFACLLGSFFCAIPALRYTVSASESRKIGDYNSANSNLRKTAILAAVALAIAVGGWAVVIMYLSGSLS